MLFSMVWPGGYDENSMDLVSDNVSAVKLLDGSSLNFPAANFV